MRTMNEAIQPHVGTIEVNGIAREVVGVLPADFRLPTDFRGRPADLLVPLVIDPDSLQGRGSH